VMAMACLGSERETGVKVVWVNRAVIRTHRTFLDH
jgi:hypothetical protein